MKKPRTPTLTEIAKATALFLRYQDGELWYRVIVDPMADSHVFFDFPVPVADAGQGAFLERMKGIQLLRWARKHLEYLNNAKEVDDADE